MRERKDKKNPNALRVAKDIVKSINEPFTEQSLREKLKNPTPSTTIVAINDQIIDIEMTRQPLLEEG